MLHLPVVKSGIGIRNRPELLAPAGTPDKMKVATLYGADAVYFGGTSFGLRAGAGNFSFKDLENATHYLHYHKKKAYVTLNTFPLQSEWKAMRDFIKRLNQLSLDAVIVADFGVLSLVREYSDIPVHYSTQASICNSSAATFLKKSGVERVILGREVSLAEAINIRKRSGVDVEMFIHGSMCMAYSGKCTISNYTSDRDANRGGCVNSCRWSYDVFRNSREEKLGASHIMNSKDLNAIINIPSMIQAGISSLKIEGRMKSVMYLAVVVGTYRKIIDAFMEFGYVPKDLLRSSLDSLHHVPNRDFTDGFLQKKADVSSVLSKGVKSKHPAWRYFGSVIQKEEDGVWVYVKNEMNISESLIVFCFDGQYKSWVPDTVRDVDGNELEKITCNSVVKILHPPFFMQQGQVLALNPIA